MTSAAAFEELLQFVYLMPVGIVKFSADGTVDLINPTASALLLPVAPKSDLTNLYESLPLVPELRQLVRTFTASEGVVQHTRLETDAGGKTMVLSLTVPSWPPNAVARWLKLCEYLSAPTTASRSRSASG
jgi:hypothetical protein